MQKSSARRLAQESFSRSFSRLYKVKKIRHDALVIGIDTDPNPDCASMFMP